MQRERRPGFPVMVLHVINIFVTFNCRQGVWRGPKCVRLGFGIVKFFEVASGFSTNAGPKHQRQDQTSIDFSFRPVVSNLVTLSTLVNFCDTAATFSKIARGGGGVKGVGEDFHFGKQQFQQFYKVLATTSLLINVLSAMPEAGAVFIANVKAMMSANSRRVSKSHSNY